MHLSVTQIAVKHLKLALEGRPADHPFTCVLCGHRYDAGELQLPFRADASYTDWRDMLQTEGYICAACNAFRRKNVMERTQRVLVTQEGVFSFGKTEHRQAVFLNPPEPPFAIAISDAKLQHLLWRTRWTLDKRMILVRLGMRELTVDTDKLKAARESFSVISAHWDKKNVPWHPYISIARELDDPHHGVLRPDVVRFCQRKGLDKELLPILRLGSGEVWAWHAYYPKVKAAPPELIQIQ